MNKKFSTLMTAGFLVAGALFGNVNATDVASSAELTALLKDGKLKEKLTDNELVFKAGTYVVDGGFLVIGDKDVTVRCEDGAEVIIKGHLVVNAEGVTVKGLQFVTNSSQTGYWQKNAITVFADKATIKDNVFTQGERTVNTWVANGVVVFPKVGTTVGYDISGNTFKGFDYSTSDGSTSTSLAVYDKTSITAKSDDPVNTGGATVTIPEIVDATFNPASVVAGNTFEDCYLDYLYKKEDKYTLTQITYNAKYLLSIEEAVQMAPTTGGLIVVKGKASDVIAALEGVTKADNIKSKNVVIECNDVYLLLGTAVAPATDKQATVIVQGDDGKIATFAAPEKSGTQRLVASLGSEYYLLSAGDGKFVNSATGGLSAADAVNVTASPAALWKVTQAEVGGVYYFTFTNKNGEKLKINNVTTFTSRAGYKNGFVLLAGANKVSVKNDNLTLEAESASKETYLGLYEAGFNTYSAEYLNNKLGNSFNLGTTKTVEKSALVNQALRAVWLTVDGVSAQYFAVANTLNIGDNQNETLGNALSVKDNETMLKDAEFVVVGTDQYLAEVVSTGKGFAYSTKKGSDLFDFTKNKAKAGIDKAQFTTEYSVNFADIANVNSLIITQKINFGKGVVTVRPQVMSAKVADDKGVMVDKFFLVTMDLTADVDWSVINFDGNNGVARNYFDGKAFNAKVGYSKENQAHKEFAGWIYGPATEIVDPAKSNINLNGAEGQFVIRWGKEMIGYNDKKEAVLQEGFWMYNRESSTTGLNDLAETVYYLGNSIYQVKDANKNLTNKYYLAGSHTAYGDTIELTPTTLCHARLGGYGHSLKEDASTTFDKVNLATTAFRMGIKNGGFDGIAYISNSSVHNNQLEVNIKDNDGLRFFLVPTDTVAYGLNTSGKKYWEVVAGAAKDSLYRVSYAIQERTTKRFVGFNNDGKLELNATIKDVKDAQKYFFKEKGDGKFVIALDGRNNNDLKVFANIGDASLHYDYIYKENIADEFILDTIASPKYADILKNSTNKGDTTLVKINLYSVENLVGASSYMLTPGANNFLMEGVPAKGLKATGGKEYPAAGFDLVVDTAYVNRYGNTMPMYYLTTNGTARLDSVGPLHKGDKDENGHAIDCKHFAGNDTVVGKYLFAMYDSIYFGKDKNIKPEDNCYHYTNTEHFARLRFVDAKHINDTVIIGSGIAVKDTLKAGVVKSEIPANRQYDWLSGYAMADDLKKAMADHQAYINPVYDNFGLFAFEINPTNDKEYAIYNPATDLYVAYINGNVVLAPQASYYTMVKGENGTLVDNETIATTEVSVIAGNGSVSILNAAGKTVAISNILGQSLVNTTITSDNATISVPAGIVVVAVEGEAAVKAIVK